jgi:hypothetical protein
MEQKPSELPTQAWISRFWAQYNILPEHFKSGFVSLAQDIASDIEKDETNHCQVQDTNYNRGNHAL